MTKLKTFFLSLSVLLTVSLSGCKLALLDPKGLIAASEKQLLIDAVLLMLIVVIPVILLSFVFIWRYRAKNAKAHYAPNWSHSTLLEIICWTVPLIIIAILATLTWISTHQLDPYRPLASRKPVLTIQVIALDWKWLFIYPEQKIATLNYLEIPVNRPIRLLVTADAPMNSLQIPRLAGQIYAMPGMQTKLHLIANTIGNYRGFSANFSGDGFSSMFFTVNVRDPADFKKWAAALRQHGLPLTQPRYHELAKPSENVPEMNYSNPAPKLFQSVIQSYMKPQPQKTLSENRMVKSSHSKLANKKTIETDKNNPNANIDRNA